MRCGIAGFAPRSPATEQLDLLPPYLIPSRTTMFVTLDTAAGVPKGRSKSSADRACDQCKARKVRCDMGNPCVTCANRSLACSYNEERKKRGPVASRISKIQRLQQRNRVGGGGGARRTFPNSRFAYRRRVITTRDK